MTEPLKNCPFCGSDNIYYVSCYPWGAYSCKGCDADGPPIRREEDCKFDDIIRMNEAIKAWNERK